MRPVLAVPLVVGGFALTQSVVSQWLPAPLTIPIVESFLLAAAFQFPHRPLLRLTVLGGIAAELGSGLPVGSAFLGTLLPPHILQAVLRHPRPELPVSVRGFAGAGSVFLMFGAAHAFGFSAGELRGHLVLPFLAQRLLFPSFTAGALVALVGRIFRYATVERFLRSLGVITP